MMMMMMMLTAIRFLLLTFLPLGKGLSK